MNPSSRPHLILSLPHQLPVSLSPLQADFAGSAVDFLHRVGRTARAGKAGRVTSLYEPVSEALVEAIKSNIAAGATRGSVGVCGSGEAEVVAWWSVGDGGCVAHLPARPPTPPLAANDAPVTPCAGQPVEGAFSRKRSFRKKMKKYGEYVPRGQEGPAAPRVERKEALRERSAQRRYR